LDLSRLLRVIIGAIDVLFYNVKKILKFHPKDMTFKPQADADRVLDQSKISNELIMDHGGSLHFQQPSEVVFLVSHK
jgi:hypothetical protein